MKEVKSPGFFRLFWIFFKIGCFSFGGGFAMMPFIEREIVMHYKWMNSEDIIDVFAVAQSLPGSVAVNSAGVVGYKLKRVKGAVAGVIGVVLPAFIVIMLIASFFNNFKDITYVQNAFAGVRAAVVALIIYSVITLAPGTIPNIFTKVVAAIALIALYFFQVDAVIVIIISILLGLVLYRFFPKLIKAGKSHSEDKEESND